MSLKCVHELFHHQSLRFQVTQHHYLSLSPCGEWGYQSISSSLVFCHHLCLPPCFECSSPHFSCSLWRLPLCVYVSAVLWQIRHKRAFSIPFGPLQAPSQVLEPEVLPLQYSSKWIWNGLCSLYSLVSIWYFFFTGQVININLVLVLTALKSHSNSFLFAFTAAGHSSLSRLWGPLVNNRLEICCWCSCDRIFFTGWGYQPHAPHGGPGFCQNPPWLACLVRLNLMSHWHSPVGLLNLSSHLSCLKGIETLLWLLHIWRVSKDSFFIVIEPLRKPTRYVWNKSLCALTIE